MFFVDVIFGMLEFLIGDKLVMDFKCLFFGYWVLVVDNLYVVFLFVGFLGKLIVFLFEID